MHPYGSEGVLGLRAAWIVFDLRPKVPPTMIPATPKKWRLSIFMISPIPL